MLRTPDDLRALVEGYLGELAFTPELGRLEEAVRYPLESGGKRGRPVISLAVAEAGRGDRAPRGRRAARRGVPARPLLPDADGRPGARPGDARDDRRAVPRRQRR